MKVKGIVASVLLTVFFTGPAAAQVLFGAPSVADVPVIGSILEHGDDLGLSADQATALERLATDFIRETIRKQADLALARVDLEGLLGRDSDEAVDLSSTEAKLRELERIRTDLDIALVRLVEAARAELTSEQRAKFLTLMTAAPATEGGSSAGVSPSAPADPADPPGPGGSRPPAPGPRTAGPPPAGRVPPRGAAGRPPSPPHHPSVRSGFVFNFWAPFRWEPYWWDYPAAPVIVQSTPVYAPPAAGTYWYYCPSASAYYPYVSSCPEGWLVVPATPR